MSTMIEGELSEVDLLQLEFPEIPYITLDTLQYDYNLHDKRQDNDPVLPQKTLLCELIPELMDLWNTFGIVNDVLKRESIEDPYDSPSGARNKILESLIRQLFRSSGNESIEILNQAEKALRKDSEDMMWEEYHIIELVWRLKNFHAIPLHLCMYWYERAKWSSSSDPRYPFTLEKILATSSQQEPKEQRTIVYLYD